MIRSPVFIAGIASPNLDDFMFFTLTRLQTHESRSVYVVSEPIPTQIQMQGRQSEGGAEAEKTAVGARQRSKSKHRTFQPGLQIS